MSNPLACSEYACPNDRDGDSSRCLSCNERLANTSASDWEPLEVTDADFVPWTDADKAADFGDLLGEKSPAEVAKRRDSLAGMKVRITDDLQELYFHLDRTGPMGNEQIAWYGQLRAKGLDHKTALAESIQHFNLPGQDWYQLRLTRLEGGSR